MSFSEIYWKYSNYYITLLILLMNVRAWSREEPYTNWFWFYGFLTVGLVWCLHKEAFPKVKVSK